MGILNFEKNIEKLANILEGMAIVFFHGCHACFNIAIYLVKNVINPALIHTTVDMINYKLFCRFQHTQKHTGQNGL